MLVPLILILFRPGTTDAAWYSDTWRFRKLITIDSSKVPSTQTNFPVLVSITDASLKSNAQGTGNDILFTDSTGSTKLSHEIETFATGSGKLNAWVKIPSLSGSTDTKIYLYYGNPSAPSQQDPANVWDANFKGVWHMKENPAGAAPQMKDSTTNANNGTTNGSMISSQQTAGQINGSLDFDGVDDYVTGNGSGLPNVGDNAQITISAWVNPQSALGSGDGHFVFNKGQGGVCFNYGMTVAAEGLRASNTNGVWLLGGTISVNSWQHIAVVFNSSGATGYINGTSVGSNASGATSNCTDTNWVIGQRAYNVATNLVDGLIDEPRISSTARSADWITTEYNNQSDPASFLTVGQQAENKGAPVGWWKFDEGQGTIANNSGTCGKDCNGTLTGMASPAVYNSGWTENGKFNKALAFDGTNDYVDAGNSSNIALQYPMSITAWMRLSSVPSTVHPIVARDGANPNRQFEFRIASSALDFSVYPNGTSTGQEGVASTKTFTASDVNTWYFVSVTVTADRNVKLYINAQQDGSGTISNGTIPTAAISTRIGGAERDGTWRFPGAIDDVRIYDYTLSPDQIKVIYNEGATAVLGHDTSDPLNQNLAGYWKMDDGVGNACASGVDKACDSSGNNNDGTWNGNTASASGKFAFGTTYDGSGDYLDIPTATSYDSTTGTWGGWFKTSQTIGAGVYTFIMGRTDNLSQGGINVFLSGDNTRAMLVQFKTTGGTQVLQLDGTKTALNDGAWHQWVLTFDGTKTAYLYVDGQLNASGTPSGGWSFGSNPVRLGKSLHGFWTDYNGVHDDLRIYNRALSSSEVSRLYDWGPGPVGHWTFDERTGTTAFDSSGLGNTGTLTNGPKWSSGKLGSALQFDGTDDYVDIPNPNNTNIPAGNNTFTLSFWIKPEVIRGSLANSLMNNETYTVSGFRLGLWTAQCGVTNTLHFWSTESGGTIDFCSATSVAPGAWTHVTVVYTGSAASIYLNGTYSSSDTSGTIISNTNSLIIGSIGGHLNYQGILDDVRIYDYALTPKQIVSVMNADHPAVGSPVGSAIAHYKFDEGYGTKANNSGSAGSSLNGTLTGMASPATAASGWTNNGKFGKALSFDGADDYVDIADNAIFDLSVSSQYSWSGWIKSPSFPAWNTVFAQVQDSNDYFVIYAHSDTGIWTVTNGIAVGWVSDPGSGTNSIIQRSYDNVLTPNKWHHITVTYDGSATAASRIKIYVDGLNVTGSVNPVGTTANIAPTAGNINIGRDGLFNDYFNGLIDEVKLYNYALTSDEIKVEYNQGKAIVLGALSTDPDGMTGSNSAARAYCPPGDTATCNPPVAHWTLDERQGLTANDISGNANTGTLTGGPKWATGKLGQALQFDGVDDHVALGNVLGFTSSFTTSAWVYSTADNCNGLIINKNGGAGARDWSLYDECGCFVFRVSADGTNITDRYNSCTDPLNRWHHVTGVYDASKPSLDIYTNGVLDNSSLFGTIPSSINATANNVRIGSRESTNTYFQGKLDDVRVYNYARTPAQIAWEYNQGKPLAHYKLDECTGTTAHDSSGKNLHGTINIGATGSQTTTGNCESVNTAAAWYNGRNGKYNSSLNFDGTDDYVDMGDVDVLDFANNDFTISHWINNRSSSGTPMIANKKDGGSNTLGYTTWLNAGVMSISIGDGTSIVSTGAGFSPALNTWTQVTTVFSRSTGNAYVYQNGILRATIDISGVTGTISNDIPFRLGRRSSGQFFDGLIDDVRIYNYALNPTQIRTVLNEGAAIRFGPQTGSP